MESSTYQHGRLAMSSKEYFTYNQLDRNKSPRPKKQLLLLLLWEYTWSLFCAWTPRPLNGWRIWWLRLFGCKILGDVYVHPRARIAVPWNLTMHNGSSLGDGACAYSLGPIELMERSTVAQECYLCTGTHKFQDPRLPLQTAKITVEAEAFLGARAFILPGITIGEGAIVGACAVVTADVPAWTIVGGNPAIHLKDRPRFE